MLGPASRLDSRLRGNDENLRLREHPGAVAHAQAQRVEANEAGGVGLVVGALVLVEGANLRVEQAALGLGALWTIVLGLRTLIGFAAGHRG